MCLYVYILVMIYIFQHNLSSQVIFVELLKEEWMNDDWYNKKLAYYFKKDYITDSQVVAFGMTMQCGQKGPFCFQHYWVFKLELFCVWKCKRCSLFWVYFQINWNYPLDIDIINKVCVTVRKIAKKMFLLLLLLFKKKNYGWDHLRAQHDYTKN